MIIQVQDTLVSESVVQEVFACDLSQCKGACCVAGEAGAPLEKKEAQYLATAWPAIKPFLPQAGQSAVEAQGPAIVGFDGDLETPLVAGKECAYTVFGSDGSAQCGIEKAYKAGAIAENKPISCHLYPVRVKKYREMTAVNYHQWSICNAACTLGKQNKIRVHEFVKDALIRKFGEAWYAELVTAAEELSN